MILTSYCFLFQFFVVFPLYRLSLYLFKVGHSFRAVTFYQIGFVLYEVAFIESVVVGRIRRCVEFIKEKRKATVASGCERSMIPRSTSQYSTSPS
jgi:hypothetical protein